ncbi:MAG: hypothetical protein AAGC96_18900, partial [Pseudomonadota bacterium]
MTGLGSPGGGTHPIQLIRIIPLSRPHHQILWRRPVTKTRMQNDMQGVIAAVPTPITETGDPL